jgi:hypothetical protein
MRARVFPRDAIEATTARLKYGLSSANFAPLAAKLHTWRVGSAIFHSESDVRRAIRDVARHEPPQARASQGIGAAA